jgi:hypothetical protein
LKWQFEDEKVTNVAMLLLDDFVDGKIELISSLMEEMSL